VLIYAEILASAEIPDPYNSPEFPHKPEFPASFELMRQELLYVGLGTAGGNGACGPDGRRLRLTNGRLVKAPVSAAKPIRNGEAQVTEPQIE
jgi:hypothetical protein